VFRTPPFVVDRHRTQLCDHAAGLPNSLAIEAKYLQPYFQNIVGQMTGSAIIDDSQSCRTRSDLPPTDCSLCTFLVVTQSEIAAAILTTTRYGLVLEPAPSRCNDRLLF
jgi:hypothetical protein